MRDDLKPMLAHTAKALPAEVRGWAMEPKLDGWRFLFQRDQEGRVHSFAGRNGADRTGQPGEIEAWLENVLPCDTVIDAELVAEGNGNISSDVATVLANPRKGRLKAYVFDVIRVNGHDVRGLCYDDRRKLLEHLFRPEEHTPTDPVGIVLSTVPDQAVLEAWLEMGMEGVMLKRRAGTYRSGKRDRGWQKVKPTQSLDCVIVGLPKDGAGKFKGMVGAVEFDIGNGKVGRASGMTDAVRRDMTEHPERYLGRMAEFSYQLMTKGGHLRHPQFQRMRPDRDPVEEEAA